MHIRLDAVEPGDFDEQALVGLIDEDRWLGDLLAGGDKRVAVILNSQSLSRRNEIKFKHSVFRTRITAIEFT